MLTKLLSDPGTAAQATARLAALWKILVPEDIRKLATGGTFSQLVIVPDGPLALLPFEALVVGDRSDPRYLFDVAPPIVYGPSATVIYNLAEREAAATPANIKPVLTVGDPAYPAAVGAAQGLPRSSAPVRTFQRGCATAGMAANLHVYLIQGPKRYGSLTISARAGSASAN